MEETKRDISTDVSVAAAYNMSKEYIMRRVEEILSGDDEDAKMKLMSAVQPTTKNIQLRCPDSFTLEDISHLCDELKQQIFRTPSIIVKKTDEHLEEYMDQACRYDDKKNFLVLHGSETNNQYLDSATNTQEFCNLFSEKGTSDKFVWLKTGGLLYLFLREFYKDCTYENAGTLKIKTPQIFKNVKGKDIKYTNKSIKKDFKSMIERSEIEEIVKSHQNK